MQTPTAILHVWRQFDTVPMETLTKAWLYSAPGGPRQRSASEIAAHRREYGTGGNCFDLAIWLLQEFGRAGVRAHAIGHNFFTPSAHVAVLAYDGQDRYLCDLGDQWLEPVPVNADIREPVGGYFPAAKVGLRTEGTVCTVTYLRPSKAITSQAYSLDEIDYETLLRAGAHSQALLRRPLCEVRVPFKDEIAHWEFDDRSSFLSTSDGLLRDPPVTLIEGWCDRIHAHTGIARPIIAQALKVYYAI